MWFLFIVVIVIVVDDYVVLVAIPRNLSLRLVQNWGICRRNIVAVVIVIIVVDPRNLPLKFGQNRVSNR